MAEPNNKKDRSDDVERRKQSEPSEEVHKKEDPQPEPEGDVEIPAIRHVGPTIESAETKEDQQLADAIDLLRDTEEKRSIYEPGSDAPRLVTGTEPLKTRLPGDTSSEPHTDVGPDNATAVQHRGDQSHR